MRIHWGPVAFLFATAVLVVATAGVLPAAANGSSVDGMRGLLRVQSADPHVQGYVGGTFWGSYARSTYDAVQSPRLRGETIKYGGGGLTVTYAPSPYAELALRGAAEMQILNSEAAGVSESEWGITEVGLAVKTLLTRPVRRAFHVAAVIDVTTATGNTNAFTGTWDNDGIDLAGRLALTYNRATSGPGLRAHLNTGYLLRTSEFSDLAWAITSSGPTPSRSVLHGDQFLYGAAVELPATRGWTVFAEWSGEYDLEADANFGDNPMRVTPGIRWAAPGGTFVWTCATDLSVASEEAGPSWELVTGVTFGSHVSRISGLLRGVIRDADTGEPISGARIATRKAGECARTDAAGFFEADIAKGYTVLEISADGYLPKTRVVEIPAHRQVEFDFTLPRRNIYGEVKGRIRDTETGAPVPGRVRVQGTEEWAEADVESGQFHLAKVEEGMVVLEVESGRHYPKTVEARVTAGGIVQYDVSLEVDPRATYGKIRGTVTDDITGEPVLATVATVGKASRSVTTDPTTGTYEIELNAGTYALSVTGEGYAASTDSLTVVGRDTQSRDWALAGLPQEMTLKGVLFDAGTATIKRESLTAIHDAAEFLLENPTLMVVIEGHTDDTGTANQNLALSQRRADAVLKYLVVTHGIDPSRLSARGLGSERPMVPNDSAENRAKNRRIELVVQEGSAQ